MYNLLNKRPSVVIYTSVNAKWLWLPYLDKVLLTVQNIKIMSRLKAVDFSDTHSVIVPEGVTIPEALNRIFTHSPKWIELLLKLRNQVVRVMGLQTEVVEKFDARKLKAGDTIGFLQVLEINDNIAIIRGDDKHLNFVVTMSIVGNMLSCKTDVEFHNIWGRSYFIVVAPFHKLIVPAMLRSAIKS